MQPVNSVRLSYLAYTLDIIACRRFAADSEEKVLGVLVVGAPHTDPYGPLFQQGSKVGLPNRLYRCRVQVRLQGVKYVLQRVGLSIGPNKLLVLGRARLDWLGVSITLLIVRR